MPAKRWNITLALWCLNPAVTFADTVAKARSIILTSGTLSPVRPVSRPAETDKRGALTGPTWHPNICATDGLVRLRARRAVSYSVGGDAHYSGDIGMCLRL